MAAEDKDKVPTSEPDNDGMQADAPQAAGALVPFYGGPAMVPGIQAFRRGDLVLYTVRGEPKEVQELMGHLDKEGVSEVAALITHRADEPKDASPKPPDDEPSDERP